MVGEKCGLIDRWRSFDKNLLPVDDLDLSILCALRENARISNLELAKMLGVSEATIRRRIKMLEEKGIIKQIHERIEKISRSILEEHGEE